MDVLYLVMPAYNESANIEKAVADWYPVVAQHDGSGRSRMLVVDDGSKDDTYQILCSLAKRYPLLQPVTKGNEGHGATVLFGYQYALDKGADYIFQTDSDGQTLPEEFEQFWAQREKYEMIIGWRNHRQDGASRVIVTRILRIVVLASFGVWVKDANTPFRLMQADSLRESLELIPDNFNLSNVLLSVIYAKQQRRVLFLPITFRPRQGGVNSINLTRITKIGIQALKDFHRLNKLF